MPITTTTDARGNADRVSARLPAQGLALLAVAWAGCVPSQQALMAPVHAQAEARLGQSIPWRATAHAPEVEALLAAPLTADSAVRIALLNSATLQSSFEELGVRGAAFAQATAPANPGLDAELLYPLEGDDPPHIELHVAQSLTSLLQIPARRAIARADLAAGRWRAVAAAVDLAAEARVAFYQMLAATHVLAMQRDIAEAASASFELAGRLRQAGNISELALAQEQAMFEQAGLDAAGAELAVREARARLDAVLGLWGTQTAWTISGELGDVPGATLEPGALEVEAVSRSLALEELRAQGDAAARAVGLARVTSWLPDLGVGVSGKREDDHWQVGPALSLSIPIFDVGQGERAAAWARLRQVRHAYRARAIDVRSSARAAVQRFQTARARAVHLRDVVLPLRERIVEQTVLQYNAMNASPFELLVARQQQVQASRQYIESLRDAWIAWIEIEQLRAGGTPRAGASMPAMPASGGGASDHAGSQSRGH
jgi:cobalt-zinc-cadmium efflux system outer membrane protein